MSLQGKRTYYDLDPTYHTAGSVTTTERRGEEFYSVENPFTFNGEKFTVGLYVKNEIITFTKEEALSKDFKYKESLRSWPEIKKLLGITVKQKEWRKPRGPFTLIAECNGLHKYSFETEDILVEHIGNEFPGFESFGEDIDETIIEIISYSQRNEGRSDESWMTIIEDPKKVWFNK